MDFKDAWVDKKDKTASHDGDIVRASDINDIAHAVIENEEQISSLLMRDKIIDLGIFSNDSDANFAISNIQSYKDIYRYRVNRIDRDSPGLVIDEGFDTYFLFHVIGRGDELGQIRLSLNGKIEIRSGYDNGGEKFWLEWQQFALVDFVKKYVDDADADIKKYVDDAIEQSSNRTITRYGVRFGGSANTGETVQRLYNAVGMVANVGTDTVTAVNDFDNIYPWSERRRCCGYFNDDGSFVVNAYQGEPGYTTDGSNGEVWVETPLFYYLHEYGEDGSETIIISGYPIPGYKPSPIHINRDGSLRQKAYTAAYPMGMVDGKPTSRSGVYTQSMSLNTAMSNARKLGENYTTTTTAEQYTKCLLMWVEFATRNIQSVMNGCCSLTYNGNHTAMFSESSTNRIILLTDMAMKYADGQGIAIGTSLGNASIANNRTVLYVNVLDDFHSEIVFDGDPVNIAVGNVVFSVAWKTGSCDNVLSSSGSPISNINTNGKYNCIYRGEEAPFGNSMECISDVLFKREGNGTLEDPYTYDIYFLPDATKYSSGSITDDYVKVNYQLPTVDGYVKTLGYDERFPFLRIPSEIGASTTTYYADYYQYPRDALCAANVGGNLDNGAMCGPCYWNCNSVPSVIHISRRARLSYHQK